MQVEVVDAVVSWVVVAVVVGVGVRPPLRRAAHHLLLHPLAVLPSNLTILTFEPWNKMFEIFVPKSYVLQFSNRKMTERENTGFSQIYFKLRLLSSTCQTEQLWGQARGRGLEVADARDGGQEDLDAPFQSWTLHLRKASNLDGLQVGRTGEVESCTARFGYGCGGEQRIRSLENFENLKTGQLWWWHQQYGIAKESEERWEMTWMKISLIQMKMRVDYSWSQSGTFQNWS